MVLYQEIHFFNENHLFFKLLIINDLHTKIEGGGYFVI